MLHLSDGVQSLGVKLLVQMLCSHQNERVFNSHQGLQNLTLCNFHMKLKSNAGISQTRLQSAFGS